MARLGTSLPAPPGDGISSLCFAGTSDRLLASSWDSTVRVYATDAGQAAGVLSHGAPALDISAESEQICYSVGLDGRVMRHDWEAQASTAVGAHAEPSRCVRWLAEPGLVASAGWDAKLRLWDPRAGENGAVVELELPGKAYCMSTAAERLVVATSGRGITVFHLDKLRAGGPPEQLRDSALKHQTRCVACYPSGEGFAVSSVEGRVAMEYFGLDETAQAKRYAFKCHRTSETGGGDVIYPVNALAFHPTLGTFATGGGDGTVCTWDGANKKRLLQIQGYPTSIAALAFNATGTALAIAASYTFERGDIEHPADAIYVRSMDSSEVTPRVKAPVPA